MSANDLQESQSSQRERYTSQSEDAQFFYRYAGSFCRGTAPHPDLPAAQQRALEQLARTDWTFAGADTRQHAHSLHPYPAKFIPQVPRTLIGALHPSARFWNRFLELFAGLPRPCKSALGDQRGLTAPLA